jgi:hypothetical protein
MTSELVLYDGMRLAISKCAEVDEAAAIKNRAAQLEAYARVRDDAESQRKFAEIRLRACQRIGVLSAELEKAKNQHDARDSDVASKTETLTKAGVNIRTAERYEELAGGREQQAQDIALAAADSYFATTQAENEPVSMNGFKAASRSALY